YTFVKWSDNVMTAKRTDTDVIANKSVTAEFSINTYTLQYNAGSNGSIEGSTTQVVNYGGSGTPVTAAPDSGYAFVKWSDDVMTATRTDSDVSANTSVTASFRLIAGTISGYLTSSAGGGGAGGVRVTAYKYVAGSWVTAAYTSSLSGTGAYSLTLTPATYRLLFGAPAGNYLQEYWNNKSSISTADDIVIADQDAKFADADLTPAAHLTGTVTGVGGAPAAGIWVYPYLWSGAAWVQTGGARTDASGVYRADVAEGTYKLMFRDLTGALATSYYYDKPTFAAANEAELYRFVTTTCNQPMSPPVSKGTIGGTVTGSESAPLVGIRVTTYKSVSGSWNSVDTTTTKAGGVYITPALDAATYRVYFFDPANNYLGQFYNNKSSISAADDIVVAAGDAKTANAAMTPATHLTGTVTGVGGAAAANIWVYPYRWSGSAWVQTGGGKTDANGVYRTDVAAGTYKLWFRDLTGTLTNEYYSDKPTLLTADTVAASAFATTTCNEAMGVPSSKGTISGSVTTTGSAPLAGIRVTTYKYVDGSWTSQDVTTTNASGVYLTPELDPGTYRVFFQDLTNAYCRQYYSNKTTIAAANDITVVAAGSAVANATMRVAAQLAGTVTTNSGVTPLSGIEVTPYQLVGSSWVAQPVVLTNGVGHYATDCVPGSYKVYFRNAAGEYVSEYYNDKATLESGDILTLAASATTTANADLALTGTRGVIAGTVTSDLTKGPLGSVEVWLYKSSGSTWPRVARTVTAADGAFRFSDLQPDTYRVFYYDPINHYLRIYWSNQYTFSQATPVVVASGFTYAADQTMTVASQLSGRITASGTGAGISGIYVYPYRWNGSAWVAQSGYTTDGTGYYNTWVSPGTYRLYFRDTSGNWVSQYYNNKATLAAADDLTLTMWGSQTANAVLTAK
ncbi:MAG: hypothetical protein WCP28_18685, partial [Actinomycetes bacterium]